jgi:hypothetical protein
VSLTSENVAILEELDAMLKKPKPCVVCLWLESLPPSDQATWDAAFVKEINGMWRYSAPKLLVVTTRHGAEFGLTAVKEHRRLGHRR